MPRAIWSGSVSFGLVNVPVKLVTATSSKDVKFNMLHAADNGRLSQKRFCTLDGEEVEYADTVKGYDIGGGRYVTVDQRELEGLDVAATRSIDIEEFVELSDIDPLYFEHSYYLVPDGRADKPYALLAETMQRTGKVALGKFVLRTKQYLAALRAKDGVLVLSTMLYPDEIVATDELRVPTTAETMPSDRELDMAERLVESLTVAFDPGKYHDEYREKVLALIDAKAGGEVFEMPEAPAAQEDTSDLLAALEASLSKLKASA